MIKISDGLGPVLRENVECTPIPSADNDLHHSVFCYITPDGFDEEDYRSLLFGEDGLTARLDTKSKNLLLALYQGLAERALYGSSVQGELCAEEKGYKVFGGENTDLPGLFKGVFGSAECSLIDRAKYIRGRRKFDYMLFERIFTRITEILYGSAARNAPCHEMWLSDWSLKEEPSPVKDDTIKIGEPGVGFFGKCGTLLTGKYDLGFDHRKRLPFVGKCRAEAFGVKGDGKREILESVAAIINDYIQKRPVLRDKIELDKELIKEELDCINDPFGGLGAIPFQYSPFFCRDILRGCHEETLETKLLVQPRYNAYALALAILFVRSFKSRIFRHGMPQNLRFRHAKISAEYSYRITFEDFGEGAIRGNVSLDEDASFFCLEEDDRCDVRYFAQSDYSSYTDASYADHQEFADFSHRRPPAGEGWQDESCWKKNLKVYRFFPILQDCIGRLPRKSYSYGGGEPKIPNLRATFSFCAEWPCFGSKSMTDDWDCKSNFPAAQVFDHSVSRSTLKKLKAWMLGGFYEYVDLPPSAQNKYWPNGHELCLVKMFFGQRSPSMAGASADWFGLSQGSILSAIETDAASYLLGGLFFDKAMAEAGACAVEVTIPRPSHFPITKEEVDELGTRIGMSGVSGVFKIPQTEKVKQLLTHEFRRVIGFIAGCEEDTYCGYCGDVPNPGKYCGGTFIDRIEWHDTADIYGCWKPVEPSPIIPEFGCWIFVGRELGSYDGFNYWADDMFGVSGVWEYRPWRTSDLRGNVNGFFGSVTWCFNTIK